MRLLANLALLIDSRALTCSNIILLVEASILIDMFYGVIVDEECLGIVLN